MNKERLRLALGILSGRVDWTLLSNEDYEKLGYDTYKFSYYGKPEEYYLKLKAEEIIMDAICKGVSNEETE